MAHRTFEKASEKLLSVLAQESGARILDELASRSRESGHDLHALLLKTLTHLTYSENEARSILRSTLEHRDFLRAKLGRQVDTRVALFDLLISVERRLVNPKIIDLGTFERIERSAVTDYLTGLFNRSHFDARLQNEVRRAKRYGQRLSLLLLDLDDFKKINDERGHLVGDRVLRDVGRLIVGGIRDIDIAARYGGEEFAVILPETPRSGAFVVAERIRREMERRFRRRGSLARATLSGGMACFPEDADTPEGLIAKADKALYRAKETGKNLIALYFEEKRRAERVDLDERRLRAELMGSGESGRVKCSGRLKNLSEGGALVELSEPVPVGSALHVSFSLGVHQAFRLPSTVVRLEAFAANGRRRRFEAGLRFQRRIRSLLPQLARLARQRATAG
jgi:diguanylate cyclase (GGDEF)-like protein